VTDSFLKVTVYSSLQSWPTESNEWFAIPGETCAMDAALFNYGIFNASVWVDSMVAPLGSRTVKGFRDLILFKHGALTNRKWPMHPESTIAVSWGSNSGGVRQSSKIDLLFKVVAPEDHSLLAWLPPMLFALVASRLCPCLGKL
jgi:hypothetical protein